MASYSPYASARTAEFFYDDNKFPSPSPTPSPRGPGYYGPPPVQRPATRAHFRTTSTTGASFRHEFPSPRTPSFSPRYNSEGQYATANVNGGPFFDREREAGFASPRFEEQRRTAPIPSHGRRSSTSVPQRPQTARPTANPHKKPPPPPAARAATEADAKRHKIPPGYSLKNWDPTEEPIMLLGSVFDANSLGKWIYDWTVYHHGPSTPISDMAGELWLLLIQLAGKIKRAEESVPKIRAQENKQMVEDFIEAGDRLTDKLRKLLKACEAPMLRVKTTQKKDPQLGKNAGVEFVETLFGRERELEKTERFMHSVRLWNLRFDTNSRPCKITAIMVSHLPPPSAPLPHITLTATHTHTHITHHTIITTQQHNTKTTKTQNGLQEPGCTIKSLSNSFGHPGSL
ncbi:hypothetical protein QBC41DRAFT_218263 [Cercophora samala]|uniref:Vegetative cell wall protein gp1 n=1 Tax=Cercophora samala TaxID=330535 RepID=A0AA39ZJU0_9PEZI|nr:hypothetical protein QBC41DRAFT_218263 [Cercophora samala]